MSVPGVDVADATKCKREKSLVWQNLKVCYGRGAARSAVGAEGPSVAIELGRTQVLQGPEAGGHGLGAGTLISGPGCLVGFSFLYRILTNFSTLRIVS